MNTELISLVKSFSTTPFLFVGSGLSRRYYNLPDWEGLLKIFCNKVSDDSFSYAKYVNKAQTFDLPAGLLPKVAELIELDFNEKWFSDQNIRKLDDSLLDRVSKGTSPFKAEIAMYIKENSTPSPNLLEEIELLKTISKNHITGIITTNYDCFLENIADGFIPYIGQEDLIFSPIQGIAEIYKIHGSVTDPETIVIDEKDYIKFNKTSSYLAAKLMTLFLEYPIIFLGYSLKDPNIQNILTSIVECLSDENIKKLENRFIFISYDENSSNIQISPSSIIINGKIIPMTEIKAADFLQIYEALKHKKSALPVKLLRLFKNNFYNFTLTNQPNETLRVAGIDDNRVDNEDLVMAICKPAEIGIRGLSGITPNDLNMDIVLNNLDFSADDILTFAVPQLIRSANKLPLCKYLHRCNNEYPEIVDKYLIKNFDNLLSNTIIKSRDARGITSRSVKNIIESYDEKKAMDLIAHLRFDEINLNDLEIFLNHYLSKNPDAFSSDDSALKTNLRRLIRIYDWIKYYNLITEKES